MLERATSRGAERDARGRPSLRHDGRHSRTRDDAPRARLRAPPLREAAGHARASAPRWGQLPLDSGRLPREPPPWAGSSGALGGGSAPRTVFRRIPSARRLGTRLGHPREPRWGVLPEPALPAALLRPVPAVAAPRLAAQDPLTGIASHHTSRVQRLRSLLHLDPDGHDRGRRFPSAGCHCAPRPTEMQPQREAALSPGPCASASPSLRTRPALLPAARPRRPRFLHELARSTRRPRRPDSGTGRLTLPFPAAPLTAAPRARASHPSGHVVGASACHPWAPADASTCGCS